MVEAMDLVSQSIRIPDEVDHIDVMGTSDQFLRLLEKGFPATRLSVSGRSVQLQGPADEVPLVAGVVEEMIAAAVEGAPLDGNTIAEAVQILRSPERPKPLLTAGGKYVRAKTPGQQRYLDDLESHQITFGIGPAGTGKTYLAMAMAITAFKNNEVERIILTRPAIEAGEKLGFLPGDLQSKVDPYLRPLYDALYQIMGAESFQRNMEKGLIEVAPLAYMRGRTLDNAYIILDEAQNTTPAQMKMFLTRIGFGSKVVITGDASQKDLAPGTQSGLDVAVKVLSGLDDIGFCNLTSRDVVRHPLVQKIVKAYETYEAKQAYRESKERRLTSAAAGKTTGKTKRRTEAPLRRNEKERRS